MTYARPISPCMRNQYKLTRLSYGKLIQCDVTFYNICKDLFFEGWENHRITPPAQCGVEGSVRLLLTETPPVNSVALCRIRGVSFELCPRPFVGAVGIRSTQVPVLTVLWSARGKQRAVDLGLVLFGRREIRASSREIYIALYSRVYLRLSPWTPVLSI